MSIFSPSSYCRDVLSYGYKISQFYPIELDPDKIYYGLELEHVYPERNQEDIRDKVNRIQKYLRDNSVKAIFTEDGSLNRDDEHTGIEVIVYPYLYQELLERFQGYFDEQFLDVDYAGMHVHISTSPLTELQKAFIVMFFNRTENRSLIVKISGRQENSYAKFKPKKLRDIISYVDKYEVINVGHPETLEVRIFKAAMTYEEFRLRIEFLDSVVQYITSCKCSISRLTIRHWFENTDFENYPTLKYFLDNNPELLCV